MALAKSEVRPYGSIVGVTRVYIKLELQTVNSLAKPHPHKTDNYMYFRQGTEIPGPPRPLTWSENLEVSHAPAWLIISNVSIHEQEMKST